MAQKINVVLVDDIDGSEASETVRFALDGTHYEVDLNEDHASELREVLGGYVNVARWAGGKRRRTATKKAVARKRATKKAAAKKGTAKKSTGSSRASDREVREWARGQGLTVGEKGPVKRAIFEQYAAAH